ncbi:MAG: DUF898 domain-containing protein [Gammaproteobacteria bacterium]|nr:DUF898 domain-containing protein [Gammaproteobacteria bacterium]
MATQADAAAAVRNERFAFTGNVSEYFRIWIVSLCLTIITVGFYSPWAKVRKRRYLYRSTRLAGSSFDYHADPVAILKGRLIAVGLLALYVASSYVAPGVEAVLGLAVFAAIPWLIVRSRMFNARYTSYRNLRFRFDPVYGEAYKVIVGWNLLAGLTLGLLYPHAHYRRSAMIVNNSHFGNLDFVLPNLSGGFYARYIQVSLLMLGAVIVVGVLATLLPAGAVTADDPGSAAALTASLTGLLVAMGLAASYLGPAIAKLVIGSMNVGDHRMNCHWSVPRVVFINFTNLVAIALTIGLAIPWATVRLQRYQFENMSIDVTGNLDSIIATQADEVSAMGEEIGEAFDIDIGL